MSRQRFHPAARASPGLAYEYFLAEPKEELFSLTQTRHHPSNIYCCHGQGLLGCKKEKPTRARSNNMGFIVEMRPQLFKLEEAGGEQALPPPLSPS